VENVDVMRQLGRSRNKDEYYNKMDIEGEYGSLYRIYLPESLLNTAMKIGVPYKTVQLAMTVISNCKYESNQ
jgi:hypothetical protein